MSSMLFRFGMNHGSCSLKLNYIPERHSMLISMGGLLQPCNRISKILPQPSLGKARSSSQCTGSRHKYDDFQRMHSRFDRAHSHKFS